jgi:hypothetical protein
VAKAEGNPLSMPLTQTGTVRTWASSILATTVLATCARPQAGNWNNNLLRLPECR